MNQTPSPADSNIGVSSQARQTAGGFGSRPSIPSQVTVNGASVPGAGPGGATGVIPATGGTSLSVGAGE